MTKGMAGYSLLELVFLLIVIGVVLTAVTINFPSTIATMQPESVLVNTAGVMLEAKKEALLGTANESKRTFNIQNALNLPHSGVSISVSPTSYGKVCPGQSNSNQICVSGQLFNFVPSETFVFEKFSGKTSEPHALFISNSKRKLALFTSQSGNFTVAELISNEWHTRTDIQQLISKKEK